MKKLTFIIITFTGPAFALQIQDARTICETETFALSASTFKHCKQGDLIEVISDDVKSVCELTSTIVRLNEKYLCIYRGTKRDVRKRPLSEAEKKATDELLNEAIDDLMKQPQ